MLGWDRYILHKKSTVTPYTKLVVFHLVVSAGHVVQSDASGLQNVDALSFSCSGGTGVVSINSVPEHVTPNLCFCIRCDLTYCIPMHPGCETSTHYLSCSVGPVRIP
jgi:hypothetical protein